MLKKLCMNVFKISIKSTYIQYNLAVEINSKNPVYISKFIKKMLKHINYSGRDSI